MNEKNDDFLKRINAESEARLKAKGIDIEKVKRKYSRHDKFTSKKGDFVITDPDTGEVIHK